MIMAKMAMAKIGRPTSHIFFNCPMIMMTFFVTPDILIEICDYIPLFSLSKKNAVLDQNLS